LKPGNKPGNKLADNQKAILDLMIKNPHIKKQIEQK
jgi:hypothetical protein